MVIDRFYFCNGESAGSLKEFLKGLQKLDDECFLRHVNNDRNDFVGWIRECANSKALANKVEKLKDKEKIIKVIDKKVNTPAKIKKGIIDQIKHAILNDG